MNTVQQGIWVYGYHSVITLLQNSNREINTILVLKKNFYIMKEFIAQHCQQNLPLLSIANLDYFTKILPFDSIHQGYAISVKPLPRKSLNDFLKTLDKKEDTKHTLLILDQVTDSRNIGAIIRSAVAFDVSALIVLKNHSPKENSLMNKASSGGIEQIDIIEVNNLQNTIKILKENNFWVAGLDSHSNAYFNQIDKLHKIALVLGSEGKGMRELTKKSCDFLIKIPMNSKKMESLNISNATAIALYELYK